MRPVRTSLTIDTRTGAQVVSAWIVDDVLAVHRSWAVSGWSITHCASGKALRSRIVSKDVALDATQHLLRLPDCDWLEAEPVSPGARGAALALLRALPFHTKTRAPPRAPRASVDPEPGTITHP
jgi:hypothetical protein